MDAMSPTSGRADAPGAPPSRAAAAVASLWWVGWHLPRVFLNYYAVLAAKRLFFRAFLRRGREARLRSDDARELVRAYRESKLSASDTWLDGEAVERLDALVEASGCREAVRRRKAEADAGSLRGADFFHLSQERFPPPAMRQLFAILPPDFVPALELARGRALRCLSVTYHETAPGDPVVAVGDSAYNAHPFHCDGNPKFAKLLVYLSDVDEECGPFEMIPDSRFPLWDELLRLAWQEKHFRPRAAALGRRLRRWVPATFRRDTHLWQEDAASLERRFGRPPRRVLGKRGTVAFFDGMNLHNGSRNQRRPREVLHFIFV
jgi:hypothetical protein